jgi:hypothetical protein
MPKMLHAYLCTLKSHLAAEIHIPSEQLFGVGVERARDKAAEFDIFRPGGVSDWNGSLALAEVSDARDNDFPLLYY